MPQGTLLLFDEFTESIGDGRIDLDTDTFKMILSTLSVTGGIAVTDPIPTYGAGGTTDLSTNECANGGGYTTGGIALSAVTWGQAAGVATFDANNLLWTSSASGDPADIKSAILYSDTAANKDCLGYIDMTVDEGTTTVSLLAGAVSITLDAAGLFTQSKA